MEEKASLISVGVNVHRYRSFVTGATEVIYSDSGQLPSDAPRQITA